MLGSSIRRRLRNTAETGLHPDAEVMAFISVLFGPGVSGLELVVQEPAMVTSYSCVDP